MMGYDELKGELKKLNEGKQKVKLAEIELKRVIGYTEPVYKDKEESNKWLIIGIVIALIVLISVSIISGYYINEAGKSKTKVIRNYYPKEVVVNNLTQEVTKIERHEHIIKGDKQMTCLSQPNSTKVVCYKEDES